MSEVSIYASTGSASGDPGVVQYSTVVRADRETQYMYYTHTQHTSTVYLQITNSTQQKKRSNQDKEGRGR